MRSIFFEKGIEYQIEINGENWNQGDYITGKLSTKNLNDSTITLNSINIVHVYSFRQWSGIQTYIDLHLLFYGRGIKYTGLLF